MSLEKASLMTMKTAKHRVWYMCKILVAVVLVSVEVVGERGRYDEYHGMVVEIDSEVHDEP